MIQLRLRKQAFDASLYQKNRTTFGWDLLALLAHPLPPRAIIKTEANRLLLAQMPFFVLRRRLRKLAFDAPPYHKKIAQPSVARFASFRDSVGIRTQDPQLRRLLLYPAELPNQTLLELECKDRNNSLIGKGICELF